MLKNIFLPVSLLLSVLCFAQNQVTDSSATVVSYWKKDEKNNFTLTKSIENKNDKGLTRDSAAFRVTTTILEEKPDSYTVEWKYKLLYQPNLSGSSIPGIESLCNNLRVVFKTSETGTFSQVINTNEILSFLNASFDLVLANKNISAEARSAMAELKKVLSSKESVENIIIKDVRFVHTLYGGEYLKRGQSEDVELPNVFGGDPFPARTTYRFSSYDPASNLIHLDMSMIVDSKIATRTVVDYMNQIGKKMGKTPLKYEDMPELKISDEYHYALEKETGYMKYASSTRVVNAMGSYKKEMTVIKKD